MSKRYILKQIPEVRSDDKTKKTESSTELASQSLPGAPQRPSAAQFLSSITRENVCNTRFQICVFWDYESESVQKNIF